MFSLFPQNWPQYLKRKCILLEILLDYEMLVRMGAAGTFIQ